MVANGSAHAEEETVVALLWLFCSVRHRFLFFVVFLFVAFFVVFLFVAFLDRFRGGGWVSGTRLGILMISLLRRRLGGGMSIYDF